MTLGWAPLPPLTLRAAILRGLGLRHAPRAAPALSELVGVFPQPKMDFAVDHWLLPAVA
jgi:hypothetical protein